MEDEQQGAEPVAFLCATMASANNYLINIWPGTLKTFFSNFNS